MTLRLIHLLIVSMACGMDAVAGAQPAAPPAPPVVSAAPAQVFRRVLAMTPAGREQFLSAYPAEKQAFVRAKIEEYLALAAPEREARLKALELRAQLLPLMKIPAQARAQHMLALDPARRREIEDRLRTWDILPPPLKQDVLQHETTIRFFLEQRNSGASRETLLGGQSPEQRARLEKEYEQWQALSEERREQMVANFERFFGQDAGIRSRTLAGLPGSERARLEATLEKLNQLPAEQREAVLAGYRKYKLLSPDEQSDFLRSAARWQAMTEKEREVWRRLVLHVRVPPQVMPPMPSRTSAASSAKPIAATP